MQTGILSLEFLHLRRNGADDFKNAIETIQAARERARSEHFPAEEAMALTRLADLTRQQDTAACASYIKAALTLDDAQKKICSNLRQPLAYQLLPAARAPGTRPASGNSPRN